MNRSKKNKKPKKDLKPKTIKVDPETHKLLKIYAAEHGLTLGGAIRDLFEQVTRK